MIDESISGVAASAASATPTCTPVRFEQRSDALGIGSATPRLSWRTETSAAGWQQAAYEIESFHADGQPHEQTGRVDSSESVYVAWPFAPLASREQRSLRVRVWGSDGQVSAWSETATVEAGLLDAADWNAHFVAPDWDEDTSTAQPAPLLRHEFTVQPGLVAARLYITSQGVYEAQINGATIGDHVMAPGWTSYSHRLRYQTFDVTASLQEGRNALGAMLGDGWFRSRLGFGGGRRNIYGEHLALLAQLELRYADGSSEQVLTDETWQAVRGPIQASDIYGGETYDAGQERPGWSLPGYDATGWSGVRRIERDLGTLVAPAGPPVRRIQEVAPVERITSPSGKTLLDFGQNLVGRLRIQVQGPAGHTITLRHAEVLENGELGIRPLRTASATDHYTLRGGAPETWEPRFTFHGFRYAEIENWPGELDLNDVRAVVCHSDMARTGWFECSDPLINRLHENVVWSLRGNFFDIPTDCPQRDERLGWTGDIQVFSPTATFLYDTAGFLESWLADLAAEQAAADGVVPFVVPNTLTGAPIPAAAWGDAAVVVPWVLYQRYGDTATLKKQFPSMKAWVDLLAGIAGERKIWDKGFQFGDWLDPAAPPEQPGAARTSPGIVATAYFAHSSELLSRAAAVLGRSEEAAHYGALAASVRAAFTNEYATPNGRLMSDATTGYTLAIAFSLLADEGQRANAGKRLAALVRDSKYRISTGFVGTPLICDALCSVGEYETAFRLLTERACPSWLYPVSMGATTIWERWDSMLPDGTINPGEMTSFNHYALGAVADWLHRTVAGLAPAAPGYRRLEFRPYPGGGLSSASARHETPYGSAECAWQLVGSEMTLRVVVPPNTTASVTLPGHSGPALEVAAGTHAWTYTYHEPVAEHLNLSFESTLTELMGDRATWAKVRAAIRQHAPWLAEQIDADAGISGSSGLTLRQAIAMSPNAVALSGALAEIL